MKNRKIEMPIYFLERRMKLFRRTDSQVFEPSSFVEPEKEHLPGWSFIEP